MSVNTLVRSIAWVWDSMAAWLSLSWATISIRFRLLAALSASISIFLLLLLLCRGTVRLKASSCGIRSLHQKKVLSPSRVKMWFLKKTHMKLRWQCFVFTCTVQCVDTCHCQFSLAPPLQRVFPHCCYSSAYCRTMSRQQVTREVKNVASIDRPLSLYDSLTDVVHPIDHDSILRDTAR